MASSPVSEQQRPADGVAPVDRVERNEYGILQTVCCQASVAMASGNATVCADCGDVISRDLAETTDLLGAHAPDPQS